MKARTFSLLFYLPLLCLFPMFPEQRALGQLFENLEAFGSRLDVGDPRVESTWRSHEGPKGVAVGDLDGDGAPDVAVSNLDGTVTVYFNRAEGEFSAPTHLRAEVQTLRGIVLADINGDDLLDIAAAAPLDAKIVLFLNKGGGGFQDPRYLRTWLFARNLAAGDFDGDGNTDLAVGGSGVGLLQYRGDGTGSFIAITDFPELDAGGSSKPVYSMKTISRAKSSHDQLVVTHAQSPTVWILSADDSGTLRIRHTVAMVERDIYDLDVGAITGPRADGRLDLVTAHRNTGVVEIHRGTDDGGFNPESHQRIEIDGGPRAIAIIDLDGDGWNDLVVVLRYFDRIVTYRNENGSLVREAEMPVGVSPRDLAYADFNGDGQSDVAVINRISSDVSILTTYPGRVAFSALDQYYLVDGEVSGLWVMDLNGDGRDDVIQVHRRSGDVSVRLAQASGSLEAPGFYPMGLNPNDLRIKDINDDGFLDLVTANIGSCVQNPGSVSLRYGTADGSLGPLRNFEAPPDAQGSMFALELADFDGDGYTDMVVGYFDCRIAFFKGSEDGTFTFEGVHFFLYEPRTLAVGDFDQDGDMDLAGGSAKGMMAIVENVGDLPVTRELTRVDYEAPTESKFGTRSMTATDINKDGDLDLVLGSGNGVMVYLGSEGMSFELSSETLPGTDFPASSVASGDFDGDGDDDVVVTCRVLSCIVVLTQKDGKGEFFPAINVDVPAGRFVATGDLDGDGQADIVGSGEALWTALSSRQASFSEPPVLEGKRQVLAKVVINEILAINNSVRLESDGGKKPDWVELFNGSRETVSLAGWTLVLSSFDEEAGLVSREFSFPADTQLDSGARLLVVFSKRQQSPLHTGFKLPGDGGKLFLLNAAREVIDEVEYPDQIKDVSYARYEDGLPSFAFNPYPSAGKANVVGGNLGPAFHLDSVEPADLGEDDLLRVPEPGEPLRFLATGEDDVGIVTARLLYQRSDAPGAEPKSVILYDDGFHGDGEMLDGVFAGILESGLPPGGWIRFRIEVEDISDNVSRFPKVAAPSTAEGVPFYSISVGNNLPRLEISEVVARNVTGLLDEAGGTADWVEIHNCSSEQVSLDRFHLGKTFPAYEKWFNFPDGMTLPPDGTVVVFCDGHPEQGPLHAPFDLKAGGDRLVLVGTAAHGDYELLDVLDYGQQQPDMALARLYCGGEWVASVPTPGMTNVLLAGDVDLSGSVNITDVIGILNYLFGGGSLACPGSVDTNGDLNDNWSDAVYLFNFLFNGGPAPLAPLECR